MTITVLPILKNKKTSIASKKNPASSESSFKTHFLFIALITYLNWRSELGFMAWNSHS
jgi:hypothetical protein